MIRKYLTTNEKKRNEKLTKFLMNTDLKNIIYEKMNNNYNDIKYLCYIYNDKNNILFKRYSGPKIKKSYIEDSKYYNFKVDIIDEHNNNIVKVEEKGMIIEYEEIEVSEELIRLSNRSKIDSSVNECKSI